MGTKHYIPDYLTTRQNLTRLVLWTALYAWLFISIYQPFNSRQWVPDMTELQYFLFGTLVVVTAMTIIAISRIGMCYYCKKHALSYFQYALWVAAEIMATSLFYALFPIIFVHNDGERFLSSWGNAAIYTFFILLIPYAIVILALIMFHYRDQLEAIEARKQAMDDEPQNPLPDMFNFYDDKNELKLSLRPDTLYYLEAADNYVMIHYSAQGKLQHYMLRATLRDIEEKFQDVGLRRTHRSYIVNFSRVKLLKRTNDGLMIDFDMEGVPNIPVSKTYMDTVMEQLVNAREQEDDETLYQHFK